MFAKLLHPTNTVFTTCVLSECSASYNTKEGFQGRRHDVESHTCWQSPRSLRELVQHIVQLVVHHKWHGHIEFFQLVFLGQVVNSWVSLVLWRKWLTYPLFWMVAYDPAGYNQKVMKYPLDLDAPKISSQFRSLAALVSWKPCSVGAMPEGGSSTCALTLKVTSVADSHWISPLFWDDGSQIDIPRLVLQECLPCVHPTKRLWVGDSSDPPNSTQEY